jgi:hypothetical protein
LNKNHFIHRPFLNWVKGKGLTLKDNLRKRLAQSYLNHLKQFPQFRNVA